MNLELVKPVLIKLQQPLDTFVIKLTGFKQESEKVRWYSVAAFRILEEFKLNRTIHKTIIEGKLPPEGGVIFTCNHLHGERDALKTFKLGRLSGRLIRAFAKASLLDPNYKEPPEVTEKYGEQDESTDKDSMDKQKQRAFLLRGFDFISTPRGGITPPLSTIKEGFKTLRNGQILGIAIEGTRRADGTIQNPLDGVAMIAERFPDTPIVPAGFSGPPNGPELLRVGPFLKLREILKDPNFNRKLDQQSATTLYLTDAIANLLPEIPKNDWFSKRREKFITERMTELAEATANKRSKSSPN